MQGEWDALRMNAQLTRKYDIHFNFFLTKPANEIIYNHTSAISTIAFKDAVILADTNEYLKRYYFLRNALDKDEIYDRINLLAEFYGSAVLLRYEYPLMVLTRTKSVFLKRLKRMKKILVEEGSSDESHSDPDQKAISINSSQFLRSVSSSELERKSLDDHHFQLDFSLLQEAEPETHDIFADQEEETSGQNLFLANITRLTREIACELTLERDQNEGELKHLLLDFEEDDREDVMRRYQRLIEKENSGGMTSSKQSSRRQDSLGLRSLRQPLQIRELLDRKPMASSITITALEDQPHPNPTDHFRKKSMIAPLRNEERGPAIMKRSSYYQYEMEHHNFPLAHEMVIAEDEMEDSPNKNFMKKVRKFPSMDQQDFGLMSQKQLPRGNPPDTLTAREKVKERGDRNSGYHSPLMKYSSMLQEEPRQRAQSKPFGAEQRRQDYQYNMDQYNEYEGEGRFPSNHSLANRLTSINININNLEEKKESARVNVKVNGNKNRFAEEFAEDQRNYRAEKKRKIREKAAALLSRVKSQEYMRTVPEDYDYNYPQPPPVYYDRYYG